MATLSETAKASDGREKAEESARDARWPSHRSAWLTVWLLFAAYTLSFVDRQILVLLIAPIQRDLGITDVQFSLLSGLAFTFFYTIVGIPLAWVADRASRRNLIAISIVFWSLMTAACGFARNFAGMFLARIGVGVGEAGLSPAAYSMMGDSFPLERRGRPMAVYTLGSSSGLGLAMIVGGGVAQWALTAPPMAVGGDLMLQGWQLAFLVVSLPGPLLALLFFLLVREPARRERAVDTGSASGFAGWFRVRWKLFLLLCFGFSFVTAALAVYLTWIPAFFGRVHGWNPAEIGAGFGLALLIGGTSGTFFGGVLTEHFLRKGWRDGFIRVTMIGAAGGLILASAVPFVPDAGLAMMLVAPMCFFLTMPNGIQALSLQAITPNELRGRAMALLLLIGNMTAFTVAPTAVAAISSHVLAGPETIGIAMAIVCVICLPAGMACMQLSRKGVSHAPAPGTA